MFNDNPVVPNIFLAMHSLKHLSLKSLRLTPVWHIILIIQEMNFSIRRESLKGLLTSRFEQASLLESSSKLRNYFRIVKITLNCARIISKIGKLNLHLKKKAKNFTVNSSFLNCFPWKIHRYLRTRVYRLDEGWHGGLRSRMKNMGTNRWKQRRTLVEPDEKRAKAFEWRRTMWRVL